VYNGASSILTVNCGVGGSLIKKKIDYKSCVLGVKLLFSFYFVHSSKRNCNSYDKLFEKCKKIKGSKFLNLNNRKFVSYE
jgi:hypothetical protein